MTADAAAQDYAGRPAGMLRGADEGWELNMQVWPGHRYPLGATYDGTGTNFAIFAEGAVSGVAGEREVGGEFCFAVW